MLRADTLQHIENTPQAAVYVGRYVAMMVATHSAISLATSLPTLLWVSTDRMWTASPW